jgi:hypothetical protein
MKTIKSSTICVLCLIALALVLSTAISAQQEPAKAPAAAKQKEKEAEQRQELEKKTRALLHDVASAAWSLKLPENRIFVMTSTADLLWALDEKRARNLYWEAINSINLLAPTVRRSDENLPKAERLKDLQAYTLVFGLRRNILRQVAQRDPQLALEMLRATRQVPPRESEGRFRFPDDRQLEQEIASEVAARDPAQALQLARESLAKGVTFELLNLIQRLARKDPAKASEFAGEIISKLRMTNMATDVPSATVAIQLLQNSRMPEGDGLRARLSAMGGAPFLSDEQRRDLAELVSNAALSASANSNLLFYLTFVLPDIQQFFPERHAALEQRVAAFKQTLNKQQRDHDALNEVISRGIPEELVRLAHSQTNRERFPLYQQAAILAVMRGNADSFRELARKEIRDEDEQRKILDLVDAEQISVFAGRKQVAELRKLLPKIRSKEERARALVETALILKEKGEDAEAATLLDEAATLIKTDLSSETQTNALLVLLCAYAVIDPPKAFALAERTIDEANDQISLLMLLDRVVKSGAVKKSEIILDQAGIMPLDMLIYKYGKGVGALAKADFNRTRALADRFDRPELRVMARLLIAKGILSPTSPQSRNYVSPK